MLVFSDVMWSSIRGQVDISMRVSNESSFTPDGVSPKTPALEGGEIQATGRVRDRIGRLFSRRTSGLLGLPLLLCLQACNMMHRPSFDEDNGFQDASPNVDYVDYESRREDMLGLLASPTDTSNRALMSGISEEQRDRVMEHFEALFRRVRITDFVEFARVCHEAKEKLGIMNFDRYEPRVLRETLLNFDDPEHNSEKPEVIVIIARPDESTIGGIQPLNVESYQVGRLLEEHKVFLFECGSIGEVLFQLNRLKERQLIHPGRVRGLVIGAHGDTLSTGTGIDGDNLHSLGMLSEYFDPHQATIVFASCYSGSEGDNLVSRTALFFGNQYEGKLRVLGCDGLLAGVDLGDDVEDEIQLESLASILTLGLINNTYISPPYQELYRERYDSVRDECGPTVTNGWLRRSFACGIWDASLIRNLFEKQITPERYIEDVEELADMGISLSPELLVACLEKNLDSGLVRRFVESRGIGLMGVGVTAGDIELFGLGITQELLTEYRRALPTITDEQILILKQRNVSPSDLGRYRHVGVNDFNELAVIIERGIPPALVTSALSMGRTTSEIAAGIVWPPTIASR